MSATAKEIQTIQPAGNPYHLLQLGVERNLDVDKLGQLMELYSKWEEREAKKAYDDAFQNFQDELPPIPKTKPVKDKNGSIRYHYAPLDAVLKIARPHLHKHGFTYRWGDAVPQEDGSVLTTCYLRHRDGHQESASFPVPHVTGYGTNAAQDLGSANSYGRRYSFAAVTGIVVDDDDDGATATAPNQEVLIKHNAVVREWMPSILRIKEALEVEDFDAAAEVIAEMPRPVWQTLWKAPTYGGMWTTEERKILKEDKDLQDAVHTRRLDSGWYDRDENKL